MKKERCNEHANGLFTESDVTSAGAWTDQDRLKMRLNDELQSVQMSEKEKHKVMQRVSQKPNFWNRKITISVPGGALALIVLVGVSLFSLFQYEQGLPELKQPEIKGRTVFLQSGTFYEYDLIRILHPTEENGI